MQRIFIYAFVLFIMLEVACRPVSSAWGGAGLVTDKWQRLKDR